MRLFCMVCPSCPGRNISSQYFSMEFSDYPLLYHDLNDDLTAEAICKAGHGTVHIITSLKFTFLFDLGFLSIVDGNTRAAVMNFSSALEEFFKSCIKIFLLKTTDENEIEEVDSNLKFLNRSEKILGAYCSLYYYHFKKDPPRLEKQLETRNKVVHSGFIPSEKEAISYGQAVRKIITEVIVELQGYCPEKMHLVYNSECVKRYKKASEIAKNRKYVIEAHSILSSGINWISLINRDKINFEEVALDELVEKAKKRQNKLNVSTIRSY